MDIITQTLIKEFNLKEFQAVNTIKLIDEGNTIPFIARYRKEVTGELSDEILRGFYDRLTYLRNIEEKKAEVIRLIDEQGLLTEEITNAVNNAKTLTEIDDIYRPFRPKRRTRSTIAKEKGLEPLAQLLLEQDKNTDIMLAAAEYINEEKEVNSADEALAGAMDIIAEMISDNADYRKELREKTYKTGMTAVNYFFCVLKGMWDK